MVETHTYIVTIERKNGTREARSSSPAWVLSFFLMGFLAASAAALSTVALGLDGALVGGHPVFAYWVIGMVVCAVLFLIGFATNLARQADVSIVERARDRGVQTGDDWFLSR